MIQQDLPYKKSNYSRKLDYVNQLGRMEYKDT